MGDGDDEGPALVGQGSVVRPFLLVSLFKSLKIIIIH